MLVVRRTVVELAKTLVLELVLLVVGVETKSGLGVFCGESGEGVQIAKGGVSVAV